MISSFLCDNCGIKVSESEDGSCPGCGHISSAQTQNTLDSQNNSSGSPDAAIFSLSGLNENWTRTVLTECEKYLDEDTPRNLQQKSIEQVKSILHERIGQAPDQEAKYQLHAYLSEIHRMTAQYSDAIDSGLIGTNSTTTFFNHQSHNSILDSLLNLEKYDELLKHIKVADKDKFPHSSLFLMNYYSKIGKHEEALEKCDEYYSDDFSALNFNRANILLNAGKKDDAEYIFTKLLSKGPKDVFFPSAVNTLAFSIYIPQGRLQEAEQVLLRVLCTDNERERINGFSNLALVALQFNEFEAAKRYASLAINHPELPIASEARLTICQIDFRRLQMKESATEAEWRALLDQISENLESFDFDDAAKFFELYLETLAKIVNPKEMVSLIESQYQKIKSAPNWSKQIDISHEVELLRFNKLANHYLEQSNYLDLDKLIAEILPIVTDQYLPGLLEYLKTPFAAMEVRRLALKNSNLDFISAWAAFEKESEILYGLAKFPQEVVQVALALNPKVPDEICMLIAKRRDLDLDYALSTRSNLSKELVEVLVKSEFDPVRKTLAEREDLDESIYKQLATDASVIVRDAIRENAACSLEIKALAALGSL